MSKTIIIQIGLVLFILSLGVNIYFLATLKPKTLPLGGYTAADWTVGGNLSVTGTNSITGASTFTGAITASGATTLSGTNTLSGATTLSATTTISNAGDGASSTLRIGAPVGVGFWPGCLVLGSSGGGTSTPVYITATGTTVSATTTEPSICR